LTDRVAFAADVAAAWHTAWLHALGLRSERRARVWCARDAPPVIYWTGITLAADATSDDLRELRGTVCDSWSAIDLAPQGFTVWAEEPWFVRPPGPLSAEEVPAELELVRVATRAEVEEFERVSVRGFHGDDVETGAIHPASILDDTRMTMLTGRVDGEAVAAAMSYRTERGIGIYGVTTVASARRRGYASALTRALLDPDVPAALSPSAMAESMYRRLGFTDVGALRMWQRR
jgi:ribosomal protein S18 acetylase RimI-like enzyme